MRRTNQVKAFLLTVGFAAVPLLGQNYPPAAELWTATRV